MTSESIDNIKLYYDPDIDSGVEIVERVSVAYRKNKQFFGQSLLSEYKIHLLYKREDMDKVCGFKTEPWLVGTTTREGEIFIFSPKIFNEVSSHPASDFEPVLTHELAHIFLNEISKFYQPVWLNEGVAGYVAEQYKNKFPKKISDFEKLHCKEDWNNGPNYAQSSCFVSFLIEMFGKDRFLQFLEVVSKNKEAQDEFSIFSEMFSRHFNVYFEQIVEQWQKKGATTTTAVVAPM